MKTTTLSHEDAEKFLNAAKILAQNRVDTIAFADRSEGITNGNSRRKTAVIAKLLGRPLPKSDSNARAKAIGDAVEKVKEFEGRADKVCAV